MAYMNIGHLMVTEIGWEGTALTACYGEHGNELACCIKGREFDL
jgi:hypothetical protein